MVVMADVAPIAITSPNPPPSIYSDNSISPLIKVFWFGLLEILVRTVLENHQDPFQFSTKRKLIQRDSIVKYLFSEMNSLINLFFQLINKMTMFYRDTFMLVELDCYRY